MPSSTCTGSWYRLARYCAGVGISVSGRGGGQGLTCTAFVRLGVLELLGKEQCSLYMQIRDTRKTDLWAGHIALGC